MGEETIVITGGAGFVGRYLLGELRREEPQLRLVVWDKNCSKLPPRVKAQIVDITEPTSYQHYLEVLQPTWIVHLAAMAAVSVALKDPQLVFRVNCDATVWLLETIEAVSPATRVFVVSSADIYGRASAEPLAELPLSEARPANPYARSKFAMEQAIEERFLERVMRVRPFPHIGPGQSRGFVTADFASQIAAIEAGKQEPVIHVGNLKVQRDFTDVRDVVRAYRLLLERGKVGEVYHVASGKAVSIRFLLDILLAQSTVPITVERDVARLRPADVPILVGDVGKLKRATGWEPRIPLERSLRDIIDWWHCCYTNGE